jgi:hypothetical protein
MQSSSRRPSELSAAANMPAHTAPGAAVGCPRVRATPRPRKSVRLAGLASALSAPHPPATALKKNGAQRRSWLTEGEGAPRNTKGVEEGRRVVKLDRDQQLCHLSPPPRPDRPLSGTRPPDTRARPGSLDTQCLGAEFQVLRGPAHGEQHCNPREASESPIRRALLRHNPPHYRSERRGLAAAVLVNPIAA